MAAEPDPDLAREAIEYCYAHDWTDGLPVVPASRALVDEFLAHTSRSPHSPRPSDLPLQKLPTARSSSWVSTFSNSLGPIPISSSPSTSGY